MTDGTMPSASAGVRDALIAALRRRAELAGVEGLRGETGAIALPQASIDTSGSTDWGTKSARGREFRTMVSLRVSRRQEMRLPSMIAGVEAAGEGLAGDVGGWCVASAVLLRSRSFAAADGTRMATIEHRVRVLEA